MIGHNRLGENIQNRKNNVFLFLVLRNLNWKVFKNLFFGE